MNAEWEIVIARNGRPAAKLVPIDAAPVGLELASGEKTCIDCHKGIAHTLPDMSGVK